LSVRCPGDNFIAEGVNQLPAPYEAIKQFQRTSRLKFSFYLGKGNLSIEQKLTILQVLAIEFVTFAIEFVTLAIEFIPLAIEFITLAIELVPLAIEFITLAIEFVPLAIEFITLAIEFVALAIEFVALARKFVITELTE